MFWSAKILAGLLSWSAFASAQRDYQRTFTGELYLNCIYTTFSSFETGNYQQYNEGLFTPAEDLSILSETEYTTLSHPEFPRYSVRVKKSPFCDDTVK